MKSNAVFLGVASFSLALMLATGAQATTPLLSLIDEPTQSGTSYSLPFIATDSTTTISISGYQPPSFEYATNNSLTLLGSTLNLLGGYWNFTPAANGSFAESYNDGTSVPGLLFGGLTTGDYDTFSQAVPTTPGDTYVFSFLYSNNLAGNPTGATPNGFLVAADGVITGSSGSPGSGLIPTLAGVPEPSTWSLALLGLAALGLIGARRREIGVKTSAPPLS